MIRLSDIHADLPEGAEVRFIALVWSRPDRALEAGLLPGESTTTAPPLAQAMLTYAAAHALLAEGERLLALEPRRPA